MSLQQNVKQKFQDANRRAREERKSGEPKLGVSHNAGVLPGASNGVYCGKPIKASADLSRYFI
jgi:hypothetical protein